MIEITWSAPDLKSFEFYVKRADNSFKKDELAMHEIISKLGEKIEKIEIKTDQQRVIFLVKVKEISDNAFIMSKVMRIIKKICSKTCNVNENSRTR